MNSKPDHYSPIALNRRNFIKGLAGSLPLLCGGGLYAVASPRPNYRPERDMAYLRRNLPVMPRNAWTNEKPLPQRMTVSGGFNRITVHHTGAVTVEHTQQGRVVRHLNGIRDGHLRLNYGDIGYHFVIDYAGRVWEGRSLAYEGAHVSGHNNGNLGIMLAGNFENQQPSAAQLRALNKLTALFLARYRIPRRRLFAHRDLTPTVCPGKHLYFHVISLRNTA